MGYFSELSIDYDCYEDYNYPSPEMQLRWRIDDLKARLDEISKGNYGITAHYFIGCQFSEENLAYTPPEFFSRTSDVMAAISIAEKKIVAIEEKDLATEIKDDIDNYHDECILGQLTIWDIIMNKQPKLEVTNLDIAA